MEFLVRTVNRMPADTPEEERSTLRTAERARAAQLRELGILKRLWRVPGTTEAVGLWEAPDTTALHDAIASLPTWAWLEVKVEALAMHPQERTVG
jgi:muconolactone D-isomerase